MDYIRNSDPNYFIHNETEANCGSYAFNIQGWYDPERPIERLFGSVEEYLAELYAEGFDEDDAAVDYASLLIDGMLEEWGDELRCLNELSAPVDEDEELISFRTYVSYWLDEDWLDIDYDFHFKVFRNGEWSEKMGWHPVEKRALEEWGKYNSKTFYFAHRIGGDYEQIAG